MQARAIASGEIQQARVLLAEADWGPATSTLNIMETSLTQALKLAIASATGLSKDALHIYAGLAVFFLAAVLARNRPSLAMPWSVVLLAALLAEALDLRDDLASMGRWRWAASLHDVLNTIFWPSVLAVLVHLRVFRWGRDV